jgi:type III pantothenate kinase
MKILAIDCGNTRLKCAWFEDAALAEAKALDYRDFPALEAALKARGGRFGQPERIVVSNVAGDKVRGQLARALQVLDAEPLWIRARARQCGVTNLYSDPGQLGSDRWAALIGAWMRERGACLVVGAGTATTVDALSVAGEFLGGLILPGLDMMREALSAGTAGLSLVAGRDAEFPRNTADAIWSGCMAAQLGAIERMRHRLPESASILMSGGAARLLQPALNRPGNVVDNLVLEGLAQIAMDQTT